MAFIDFIIVASGASYAGFIIPVFFIFLVLVQRYYVKTSRQLHNIQLAANAPLMGLLNETASGIQHIRAYRTALNFEDNLVETLDASLWPHYQMYCI